LKYIIASILALFLSTTFLYSQETGKGAIHGKIYDGITQEPLIGANVIIVGTSFGDASDADGAFRIGDLEPGTVRLKVSMIGYKTRIIPDVVVATARQVELKLALEPMAIGLGEVVVEADYFLRNADAPVSTQTLSYEEIRRAPGGLEDVVRAIAVLPGVAQPSSGRNDLIVRGGAPSENLYMVDGLEVPNINHFGTQGATGGPISFIDVELVQDVTFSTGGFGTRYGDKLSSVMSVNLREGRTDRLGGKLTVSATQFGLNTEGPIGDNGSFMFSARRSYLDFIFKAAGFGFIPGYWDFLGKMTYSIDKENSISLVAIGVLDDVEFINDTEDKRFSNSRVLGNAQNQYFSALSWRRLMGNGYMTLTLGRTFVDYEFLQSDSLLNPVFKSASGEGETSLGLDGVFLLSDGLEFSFGGKAKHISFGGDYIFPDGSFVDFNAPIIQERIWDTTAYKYSAYTQFLSRFGPGLTLSAGVRADYFSMIENPMVFSPRASARYDVTQTTSFTLSGGRYFQAPSYIWLVSNPENANLNHIAVDQAVLGIEHLFRPDLRVRVEGYIKSYSDYPASIERRYLVLANTGAGFGGSEDDFASFGLDPLTSDGTGRARGVELLVQKRLSDIPLYGIMSLSYNKAEFTALDGIDRDGAYDQRIIFNLSGGWKIDNDWEVSAKFRFGTGMPYTGFNVDGSKKFDEYNAERLSAGHALDLRVDRRWNFSTWNLITFIDIQNVYNRKNIQAYRWDVRNQKVESTGGAIGILPTIGVSAEF
jgi:TonB-dependent receptor-like protein/carboxypeptidase-like protein